MAATLRSMAAIENVLQHKMSNDRLTRKQGILPTEQCLVYGLIIVRFFL